jgi:hypothetical protein
MENPLTDFVHEGEIIALGFVLGATQRVAQPL